ncbi:autotransporter outer membrane beta-barrel domain-containing protein, partial [Atlantibacter subterraneus]|uniref:autotransporter outer membrane beta-barrel domain-containing protein n=1 Tax=Atlantibacter subterraneus TaxID=255519 RepID=UPI002FDE2AD6
AASSPVGGQDAPAALAVLAPQTLVAGQGGLRIDGSLTADVPAAQRDATANAAVFGEQSLLMVNSASTTNGNVALTASSGTLSVADSAKLYIADAQANRTYAIADGFTSLDFAGNGWRDANLIANKLLQGTLSPTENGVNVTTTAKRASEVLPGVMVSNALDRMMNDNANAVNSPDAGVRMLSRAIEAPSASVSDVVKTLNSAAQLAVAGGVQSSSLAVNKAVNNAIYDRNAAPDLDTAQDAGVWVQALYGNQQSDDFSAGNTRYGYDTDFWGVIVGVDKDYALANGNLRTGVAVNTGKGKTDSDGDFNATRDDFNFTGVSLYQNWRNEAFNLTADVGYSAGSHDLSQHLPGWAGMGGKLKADNVDTSVLTVGLNGEYVIDASVLNIIPHVGARYNQLTTDGFTTRASGGEGVFKTDKTRQDIWQFPVGVRLNKTWAMDSGWALSTDADMSVVFTSGDTDVTSKVRATGIPASDRISAEVMDKTAFEGKLGVKMQKGNMTWGVGYSLDASSHNTGQQVGISYRYTF